MVDIHCHILPEVDDGPKSWETTLEMCNLAEQRSQQTGPGRTQSTRHRCPVRTCLISLS
ncbi:MAG: CpsB/CapC family capsule biosynthesis tyrosine phosphatase [Terriglobales bacterium]